MHEFNVFHRLIVANKVVRVNRAYLRHCYPALAKRTQFRAQDTIPFLRRILARYESDRLPIMTLDPSATLPADATLGGRNWRPDVEGPSVVAIRAEGVFDVTKSFPTYERSGCRCPRPAPSIAAPSELNRRLARASLATACPVD
jgi:hypothetical protein